MRPTYETAGNRQAQTGAASEIEKYFDCEMRPTPRMYQVDFVAMRNGKPVAWIEFKERNYSMERIKSLGGYMLSLHKLIAAKNLNEITGLPFLLYIKTTDGIYYKLFKSFKAKNICFGGRTDRGDPQDMEPCVLIDTDEFIPIERMRS